LSFSVTEADYSSPVKELLKSSMTGDE